MAYIDLYVSNQFMARVNDTDYYCLISDPIFFTESKTINTQTTINSNAIDRHFDELTVNNELLIYGELEIIPTD